MLDWKYSRTIMAWVGAAGFVAAALIVARVVRGAVDTLQFVLSSFASSEAVTYTVDKFLDPHEFETEFGRLLGALKSKRVVVIFDNLDRVDHDRVVEVLATIKTFLEPKDVENREKETVFVVPCDDRAIRAIRRQRAEGGRTRPELGNVPQARYVGVLRDGVRVVEVELVIEMIGIRQYHDGQQHREQRP